MRPSRSTGASRTAVARGAGRAALAAVVAVVVGSVVSLAASAPASADHENVLVEEIARSERTFALSRLAGGFATPHWGESPPYRTRQLFVVDQVGTITALSLDASAAPHTLVDVGPRGADVLVDLKTEGFDERGLLGAAFHPHFAKNGLFYTYTSEPLGPTPDFTTLTDTDVREPDASLSVIREWKVDDPRRLDAVADPAGSRVLLRIEQPQTNHNAGALVFGRDAMLYIALGDGGGSDDEGLGHAPGGNGQDLSEGNVLGKILRIDPLGDNSVNGQYGVPSDNPFVGAPGSDEIYAYGFRNPFRMSFDHGTGALFVADVGQRDIEEVSVVEAGGNYGWPVKEGTFLFNGNGPNARGYSGDNSPGVPADLIDPIAQYDHDEGTSVTGGFVYRGGNLPDFHGSYLFGDLTRVRNTVAGRFFEIDPAGRLLEVVPTNHDDNRLLITGFGRDTQGELYVMGLQPNAQGALEGVVFALVAS